MNLFPLVAITNFHKHSGLKQQNFLLDFWRLEAQNQVPWAKIMIYAELNSFWNLLGKAHILAFFIGLLYPSSSDLTLTFSGSLHFFVGL